jgi:hypothetical protein
MAHRRVVKRAMTRAKATEVRQKIERAQAKVRQEQSSVFTFRGDGQATLDRYGVTAYETVTQSRHRIARYWRVYAEQG